VLRDFAAVTVPAGSDVANLREQLSELQSKLADLDQQLTELVAQLAGGPEGQAAVRPEERSIHETKLVVLQVRFVEVGI
jgi:phage shock protein A